MRRSDRIIKSPHRYDPVCGSSREWNSGYAASIVYIIQDGSFNSNVDTNEILL